MKVMVFVKANADTEAGALPSEQLIRDMGSFNEALVEAGIMRAGDGLKPSVHGARVKFTGKKRTVIDGPFAETKELVAGYWLWEVASLAEAIEWVKRCPNPTGEESVIEIRPLYEPEDFGEAFTPELRARAAKLEAKTTRQAKWRENRGAKPRGKAAAKPRGKAAAKPRGVTTGKR